MKPWPVVPKPARGPEPACRRDHFLRRTARAGLVLYTVATCAVILWSQKTLELPLPTTVLWGLVAAALILMIPTWRILADARPTVSLIICAGILLGTSVQGFVHAGPSHEPEPALVDENDSNLDEVLTVVCDTGPSREAARKCMTEIRRAHSYKIEKQVNRLTSDWPGRAAQQSMALERGRRYVSNQFQTGWLTAEPLTADRIERLKEAVAELNRVDSEMIVWCEKQPATIRQRLLDLGLHPTRADVLADDCRHALCPVRQKYRLQALIHGRLYDTVLFVEENADQMRVVEGGKIECLSRDIAPRLQQLIDRIQRAQTGLNELLARQIPLMAESAPAED